MFLKNKEEMLEYAKKENAKAVFDLYKAKKRAKRKILSHCKKGNGLQAPFISKE